MIRIAGALTAATLIMSAVPAMANPFVQDQVVLRHADLDLATANGQRRLNSRLREAAISVCGARMQSIHLNLVTKSQRCQAEVIAEARTRIEAMGDRYASVSGDTISGF